MLVMQNHDSSSGLNNTYSRTDILKYDTLDAQYLSLVQHDTKTRAIHTTWLETSCFPRFSNQPLILWRRYLRLEGAIQEMSPQPRPTGRSGNSYARRTADHACVERTGIGPASSDAKREHAIENYSVLDHERKKYNQRENDDQLTGSSPLLSVVLACQLLQCQWRSNSLEGSQVPKDHARLGRAEPEQRLVTMSPFLLKGASASVWVLTCRTLQGGERSIPREGGNEHIGTPSQSRPDRS